MKLIFDQNISPRMAFLLGEAFPGSAHVCDFDLDNANDLDVWEFAKEKDFCIVTKDVDFSELVVLKAVGPKVVWLRVGNCSTAMICDKIVKNKELILSLSEKEKRIVQIF